MSDWDMGNDFDEDATLSAWDQIQQEERRRREDEGLEHSRELSRQLKEASKDFERSCEEFREFMLNHERDRCESWR